MTRTSLDALKQTVTVTWPTRDKARAKEFLVRFARENTARIVNEQQARAGVKPGVDMYANQKGNSNLQSVVLPGPIISDFQYLGEIILVTLGALRAASPVRSGAYRDGHQIFINGAPVATLPNPLPPGSEIMISNTVPYARRIEIGKTAAGRAFVIQVPNRIYERVAKNIIGKRYGNIAKISFGYVTLGSSGIRRQQLSSHYRTGKAAGKRGGGVLRKRQQHIGEKIQAPAIFFEAFR
jgi:hypothetical protein